MSMVYVSKSAPSPARYL